MITTASATETRQDVTSNIQSMVDQGGEVKIDLTPYDGMGATTIAIKPQCRSVEFFATRPTTFHMLPLTKVYPPSHALGGQIYSPSFGLIDFSHSSPSPWSIEKFTSSPNITFDGGADFIGDPSISDAVRNPQGLLRPAIFQKSYNDGQAIGYFDCQSSFRRFASSAIKPGLIFEGFIRSRFEQISRHCVGAIYAQGSKPYEIVMEDCTFQTVSSVFDVSVPNNTAFARDTTPVFHLRSSTAFDVHGRTKVHGRWKAFITGCVFYGNGYTGYGALEIPSEAIDIVEINNCHVANFPSQAIRWNHSEGTLFVRNLSTSGARVPMLGTGMQSTPTELSGMNVYENAGLVLRERDTDIRINSQVINWPLSARLAIDRYKQLALPPRYWWAYKLGFDQQAYAASIGWNGSDWES